MAFPGLWQLNGNLPQRIVATPIQREANLETWIELEPALIEGGLEIVGRQVATNAGPIDLLGIDSFGRLVVIEIKRAAVRRDAIAQALDYASCLSELSEEELDQLIAPYLQAKHPENPQSLSGIRNTKRGEMDEQDDQDDITICLVGTAADPDLERIISFLSQRSALQIKVVTIGAFRIAGGGEFLVRELTESDNILQPKRGYIPATMADLENRANARGVLPVFQALVESAKKAKLYPRLWKDCVMFTPNTKKNRGLFTIYPESTVTGEVQVYVYGGTFPDFFALDKARVVSALGDEWVSLSVATAPNWIKGLAELFPTEEAGV